MNWLNNKNNGKKTLADQQHEFFERRRAQKTFSGSGFVGDNTTIDDPYVRARLMRYELFPDKHPHFHPKQNIRPVMRMDGVPIRHDQDGAQKYVKIHLSQRSNITTDVTNEIENLVADHIAHESNRDDDTSSSTPFVMPNETSAYSIQPGAQTPKTPRTPLFVDGVERSFEHGAKSKWETPTVETGMEGVEEMAAPKTPRPTASPKTNKRVLNWLNYPKPKTPMASQSGRFNPSTIKPRDLSPLVANDVKTEIDDLVADYIDRTTEIRPDDPDISIVMPQKTTGYSNPSAQTPKTPRMPQVGDGEGGRSKWDTPMMETNMVTMTTTMVTSTTVQIENVDPACQGMQPPEPPLYTASPKTKKRVLDWLNYPKPKTTASQQSRFNPSTIKSRNLSPPLQSPFSTKRARTERSTDNQFDTSHASNRPLVDGDEFME